MGLSIILFTGILECSAVNSGGASRGTWKSFVATTASGPCTISTWNGSNFKFTACRKQRECSSTTAWCHDHGVVVSHRCPNDCRSVWAVLLEEALQSRCDFHPCGRPFKKMYTNCNRYDSMIALTWVSVHRCGTVCMCPSHTQNIEITRLTWKAWWPSVVIFNN